MPWDSRQQLRSANRGLLISAVTVGGLLLWPALWYGTGYQTVWETRPSAETPSDVHWRRFYFELTCVHGTLELFGPYTLQIYLVTAEQYTSSLHRFLITSADVVIAVNSIIRSVFLVYCSFCVQESRGVDCIIILMYTVYRKNNS